MKGKKCNLFFIPHTFLVGKNPCKRLTREKETEVY